MRHCVREAVAEVEPSRVTALPETPPRRNRDTSMLDVSDNEVHCCVNEKLQVAHRIGALSSFHNDCCLDQRHARQSRRTIPEALEIALGIAFAQHHRNECRGIDSDHAGSPSSS